MMAPPSAVLCGSRFELKVGARTGVQGSRPVRTELPVEVTLELEDGTPLSGSQAVVRQPDGAPTASSPARRSGSQAPCSRIERALIVSVEASGNYCHCGPSQCPVPAQLTLEPSEDEGDGSTTSRKPAPRQELKAVGPNHFRGLVTDKATGEVGFVVSIQELSADIGGRVVIRARVADGGGHAHTVVEAVSQPFGSV